jgi:hypothetical protein
MSTFKNQPVYAEAIYGWLDMTWHSDFEVEAQEVLGAVYWRFKGGSLSDTAGPRAMGYCTDSFPNCVSTELAAAWDADLSGPMLREMSVIRRVMRERRVDAAMRKRVALGWAASFALLRYALREHQMDKTGVEHAHSGLRGVYLVVERLVAHSSMKWTGWDSMKTYVREMMIASAAASYQHVETVVERVAAGLSALELSKFMVYHNALTTFSEWMASTKRNLARTRSRALGVSLLDNPTGWVDAVEDSILSRRIVGPGMSVRASHGMLIVSAPSWVVCMSASDLSRGHQLLTGMASGIFAVAAQTTFNRDRFKLSSILDTFHQQIYDVLRWGLAVPVGDEVLACKAAKRAYGAFLGELAGPVCRRETRELWKEAEETAHPYIAGAQLRAHMQRAAEWSAETSLNLAKTYKLCPAPDACPAQTLIDRFKVVTRPNTSDTDMLKEFEETHRAEMLRAYIRAPNVKLELRDQRHKPVWYDAYVARQFDEIPSKQIHEFLEWEGSATMPVRSPMNPAVWKDSGLGWDSMEQAMDPRRPKRHGNMLLRMVFDPECPMPGKKHTVVNHAHKQDTKPEGHKDPARGIYSGNLRDRLNQSHMEVAVERVASWHPAFMIGANTTTRELRARATLQRPADMDTCAMYYSFDVAGWSPAMPGPPQRISHTFWADLYGDEMFREAPLINENSKIYMNKAGHKLWYDNPEANLEGYNGKQMTCVLITLLSLSVYQWRDAAITSNLLTETETKKYAAVLLAYIDDGLSRVDLPRDRAQPLFSLFQRTVVNTFAKCGYQVELSKCYPSDRLFIFLNEVYLAGRHVAHGVKAAMTLCAESTEPHTTLVERTEAVSAGCRGATMAGLDASASAMLQAYHICKHLREWNVLESPVASAVWTVAPRVWGGLGVPTMLQLGTSGGGAAFAESVRTLKMYAELQPLARKFYVSCARSPLMERKPAAIMASPLGGSIGLGVMVPSRVPAAVRDAMVILRQRGELSPLATEFLSYASHDSVHEYAAAILPTGVTTVIQKQILDDTAAAHPHAIFAAFARRLEKSSTLSQLVSSNRMQKIIRDNKTDVLVSMEAFINRAMN